MKFKSILFTKGSTYFTTDYRLAAVNLPASIAAGDIIAIAATSSTSTPGPGAPYDSPAIGGSISTQRAAIAYKVADGTEGGTTVAYKVAPVGTAEARLFIAAAAVYSVSDTPEVYSEPTNRVFGSAQPGALSVPVDDTGDPNQSAIIAFAYGNFGALGNGSDYDPMLTATLTDCTERGRDVHQGIAQSAPIRTGDINLIFADVLNYTGNPTDPTVSVTWTTGGDSAEVSYYDKLLIKTPSPPPVGDETLNVPIDLGRIYAQDLPYHINTGMLRDVD